MTDWRERAAIIGMAVALVGLPAAASARLALVTPTDEVGAPQPYPYALPGDHGGIVPLSWSYVEELVPVVAVGASVDERCEEGAHPSINVVVALAMQQMAALDIEGAVDALDALIEDLPCLNEPISSLELARIFYYRGAALAFLGENGQASSAMRRALAIEPELAGDPNLPPEIDELYRAQRSASAADRRIPLSIHTPRGVAVRLDGNEPGDRFDTEAAGLLQWQEADGRWRSMRLSDPRDELVLGTAAGIQDHLVDRDSGVSRLAASLCESLADALRVKSVLLYNGGDEALLWDGRERTVEWLDLLALADEPEDTYRGGGGGRPDRPRATRRAPPTDAVRLALGGGMAYLAPFPYATANIDGTVRLFRGLCLGLGADLGFPVTGYRDPVILPVAHLGLRMRFGGPVHPWLGVAYRIGLDDRPGVTWAPMGVGAEVGVDIPLVAMLLLRIAAQAGVMGTPSPQFQSGVSLGFALGI